MQKRREIMKFKETEIKIIREAVLDATDYLLGICTLEESRFHNSYSTMLGDMLYCTPDLQDELFQYSLKRIDDEIWKESRVHQAISYWTWVRTFNSMKFSKEMLEEINRQVQNVYDFANMQSENYFDYDTESRTYEWFGEINTNVIDFWMIDSKRPHFRTKDTLYRITLDEVTIENKKAMLFYMYLNELNDIKYISFYNPDEGKEEKYKITDCELSLKTLYNFARIFKRKYEKRLVKVGERGKHLTYEYKCPCGKGRVKRAFGDVYFFRIDCDECSEKYKIKELKGYTDFKLNRREYENLWF